MSDFTIEYILQMTNGGLDYYKLCIPRLSITKGEKSQNVLNPFYNDSNPSLNIYRYNDRWFFSKFQRILVA